MPDSYRISQITALSSGLSPSGGRDDGTRVFIPRDFGGKPGRVVLEAVHRSVKARIYWYVDEQFLGVTHSIHQQEVWLKEGRHTLTLMDEEGHILQQVFRVVGKEIPGGG